MFIKKTILKALRLMRILDNKAPRYRLPVKQYNRCFIKLVVLIF